MCRELAMNEPREDLHVLAHSLMPVAAYDGFRRDNIDEAIAHWRTSRGHKHFKSCHKQAWRKQILIAAPKILETFFFDRNFGAEKIFENEKHNVTFGKLTYNCKPSPALAIFHHNVM